MDNNNKVCFINGRGYKMAGLKKLPIGIENFEEMRREDFYYVDKSHVIEQLLTQWGKVNLFTRPRRFGKTMGMGMLAQFLIYGPITGGYSMVLKLSTMKHCAVHG